MNECRVGISCLFPGGYRLFMGIFVFRLGVG